MIPILINTNASIDVPSYRFVFDGNDVDVAYIMSITQQVTSFNDQFKLGSTLCRVLNLQIDKRALDFTPSKVEIYDQSNTILFTLNVDYVDDSDDFYYTFTLMDEMIRFNKEFEYNYGHSVLELLQQICLTHGISLKTTNLYLKEMVINWSQIGMSERDFIGYVAEVNGGYAYIDNSGDLNIVPYVQDNVDSISVENCSSFRIGDEHIIDRVYVELAEATKYYPQSSNNETIYLDSNNILLTDSGTYSIDTTIQHIHSIINNFRFFNIVAERCPINDSVRAGQVVNFINEGNVYPTIFQIDYQFNNGWYGGLSLELKSSSQKETDIKNATERIAKEINIIVDRELGEIRQQVSDNNTNISTIIQNAESVTGIFKSYETTKYIQMTSEGLIISGSEDDSKLQLTQDGVYVKDSDGNDVASMEANTFRTSEWLMTQTRNNTIFNIFRRGS